MSKFTIHTIDSAPADSKELLEDAKDQFGFVPNLLGELAAAPTALRAYMTLNGFLEETSFSPVEQQLIITAVSVANSCEYCVAAHSAGLKQAGLPDEEIDAVREGRSLSDSKLEALRQFVARVVENRGFIEESDLQDFVDAGYSRDQFYEVLVGVAMKTLSNYTNHIAETPLDEQLEPFAWEPVGV
ncbi:MAG: carboxymuconolactone decarboxylase family protein [Gemmatimonadetes bacterium]|uniref:Carboxymuconolactone decarboxylase family protein n=1 Tax=Candidatus Kutchimonas denitrificans TaxID=3056748 RepID=A0AAE5CC52_9BACT|nr:carboxymuconolactone decarboxylase family protein [Gemmatimonadota bacterium]NIR76682.1 carboxymuconolactone decarboxylase family protein [Candidatus Kutchimonas denitrificans]NIS01169.1 carboxymuconolactone decarboxylase family protein [Gemmatimonadota bacterium]NIT68208.1 carboxymuconolactone decarboxylase family protein [Gemmatimonadota bacterium]NIW75426.1 carboxymuconolactone decarboxylase family protein [Gemmatimonadota bacterium]